MSADASTIRSRYAHNMEYKLYKDYIKFIDVIHNLSLNAKSDARRS